jgi:apolipoprotein D and lipocalin family protein
MVGIIFNVSGKRHAMRAFIITVIIFMLFIVAFTSCKTIPEGATAVKPFDKDKYLGTWYEIARLDHKWEKNLDNVTARYSIKPSGDIRVDNRGHNYKKDKDERSIGKAKPAGDPNEGRLKVSFFGPFYSGYNVIALDKDYKYALVAGKNTKYLWLLSRTKTIPESVKKDYLKKAEAIGYETDELVWVKHD